MTATMRGINSAPTLRHGRFDPVATVAAMAASGRLTEYLVYERSGHWYLAGNPLGEVTVGPHWIRSTLGNGFAGSWSDTPWRQVHDILQRASNAQWRAYGWACFELVRPEATTPTDVLAHIMVPGIELEVTESAIRMLVGDVSVGAALANVATDIPVGRPEPVRIDAVDTRYLDQVDRAIARIRDGSPNKVIVSRTVNVPFAVNMPATYAVGRRANTPARSFLLDLGGWQAAGFSPETVLEADPSGMVTTQPLAGTRTRTGDTRHDHALRAELLTDPKEIFEHATSVKLAFDELARIGDAATTTIGEFMVPKQRGSVQHLGSRVQTRLAEPYTSWDALAAVFPAVTASGIPKAAACATIGDLEPDSRGLFGGTVLMADSAGMLDAALVLRTVFQHNGRAWLRAGAGVVSASTAAREHEETREKLASVAPYLVPEHSWR